MTDTFASEPTNPSGPSPDAAEQAGDVTGALAELERKLRELEQELTSIGRRRALASDTPGTASSQTSGRLVDEAIEPPSAVASQGPGEPPRAVAPRGPIAPVEPPPSAELPRPVASQGPGEPPRAVAPRGPIAPVEPPRSVEPPRRIEPQSPVEPPHKAERPEPAPVWSGQPVKFTRPVQPVRPTAAPEPAQESSRPSEAPRQSESRTSEQPERARPSDAQLASLAELRRFRDRLERLARDLAAEYDALLGRVMAGLTSAPPPVPQPPATASAPEPAAQAAGSEEDALFEGRVELGVGPFYDMASLSAFERRLAGLPHVTDASVRRFEASHAVVDLRLAAPMALVRELRLAMDSDFSIREVADGRILLTFDET